MRGGPSEGEGDKEALFREIPGRARPSPQEGDGAGAGLGWGGRETGGANPAAVAPRRPRGLLEKARRTGEVLLTTESQKQTQCSLTQSVVACNILQLFVEVVWVVGNGTFTVTDPLGSAKGKNFAPG